MNELIRKLLGKTFVVSLRLAGANLVAGILTSAEDGCLIVEQLKRARRVPVHIPLASVLFFVEEHDELHRVLPFSTRRGPLSTGLIALIDARCRR